MAFFLMRLNIFNQNNKLVDMKRTLNQLLKDAVERKPRRLSFDTTYSHDNIYDWLQTILTDWTIIIPGASCSTFALSDLTIKINFRFADF